MAGTSGLKPPPADIDCRKLAIASVPPASLLRVSRHDTGEPHFGQTGDCRFDDAQADVGKRFGTCYQDAKEEKYGAWFQVAELFEWENALVEVDHRKTVVRIISLRKANSREVKRYAKT